MSRRQRTLDALAREVADLTGDELEHALGELAGGTCAFGHRDDWDDWFGHLAWSAFDPDRERQAPDGRATTGVLEALTTAAIAVATPGMRGFDATLRGDLLAWLGRAPLRAACWRDGDWSRARDGVDPALSAALFLVHQHLAPDAIPGWARSLVALGGPRWRAQLIDWLAEAEDVLTSSGDTLAVRLERRPGLAWRHGESLALVPPSGDLLLAALSAGLGL
jgi:hypothetical protein